LTLAEAPAAQEPVPEAKVVASTNRAKKAKARSK